MRPDLWAWSRARGPLVLLPSLFLIDCLGDYQPGRHIEGGEGIPAGHHYQSEMGIRPGGWEQAVTRMDKVDIEVGVNSGWEWSSAVQEAKAHFTPSMCPEDR
jgi:hypothetical protein